MLDSNCLFLEWTSNMSLREFLSGRATVIILSNLPGLSNAASKTSLRFVAAIINTPSLSEKPSISAKSWFNVCSLSSFAIFIPAPLWRPTESISSIKIMHGLLSRAVLNRLRILDAPAPTNTSTNSLAEIDTKLASASLAIALANRVFPVPGGPSNNIPRGISAPAFL